MSIISRIMMLAGFVFFVGQASVVQAADEPAQPEAVQTEDKQKVAVVKSNNPHVPALDKSAKVLGEELSEDESYRFIVIKNNFGMIRAVRVAHNDIAQAVKKCGEKNPDMKEGMDERFAAWADVVVPSLKKHETQMSETIKTLFDEKKSADITDYLSLMDKAADFASGKIQKTPVTTPEACEKLRDSMDQSQDQLGALINAVSWDIDALIAAQKAAEQAAIDQREKEAEALNK